MLSQAGMETTTYHPRAILSTDTQQVNIHIRGGQYDLVWMSLPCGEQSVPYNKYSRVLREIAQWSRAALATHGCTVIISGARGRVWQNEDIQALLKEGLMYESRHASCQAGIKATGMALWSPLEMNMYTSVPIQSAPCTCPKWSDHAGWNDLSPGRLGARARRLSETIRSYTELVPRVLAQPATAYAPKGRNSDDTRRNSRKHKRNRTEADRRTDFPNRGTVKSQSSRKGRSQSQKASPTRRRSCGRSRR